MIRIWNIKKLKEEISSGELSESAKFFYLFFAVIVFTAFGQWMAVVIPIQNTPEVFWSIIIWIIAAIGMYVAYLMNGGKQGFDFSDKYLSISFVTFIRFLPVFIVGMILSVFISSWISGVPLEDMEESMSWIDVLVGSLLYVYYVWRVATHVRDVKKVDKV